MTQAVLDTNAKYRESSLADLYDPDRMPRDLLLAHRKLDRAVDRCYRTKGFKDELDRLDWLFHLYKEKTEGTI